EIEAPAPTPQPEAAQPDTANLKNDPEPEPGTLPEQGKTYPEPESFTWNCGIDKTKLNPLKLPKIIDAPKPPAQVDIFAHLRQDS
ncbi:MAG: hypothetical protein JNL62_15145, partial [Bryobacterales bacterium]|nr:hypothetical protein [Bryobacterales bacterium]